MHATMYSLNPRLQLKRRLLPFHRNVMFWKITKPAYQPDILTCHSTQTWLDLTFYSNEKTVGTWRLVTYLGPSRNLQTQIASQFPLSKLINIPPHSVYSRSAALAHCSNGYAAAFLQTRGFKREVFIELLRKDQNRTVLWRLTAAACGLASSSRLWYLTSNAAPTNFFWSHSVHVWAYFLFKRFARQERDFILVTQVINYLHYGSPDIMTLFEAFLPKEFDIGELNRHTFSALGSEIGRLSEGSITVTQMTNSDITDTTCLQAHRPNKGNSPNFASDVHAFWRVRGRMQYIGSTTSPTLLYHAGVMACKTSDIYICHLKEL